MKIGIIDYGAGNICSVGNALEKLNLQYVLSNDINILKNTDKLIFPGVGHAKTAMQNLKQNNLHHFLRNTKKPVLGICLGMQLLCSFSDEGETTCLGIIEGQSTVFEHPFVKSPIIGWNQIRFENNSLFQNLSPDQYFYFVHKYYLPIGPNTIAEASHGIYYSSAIQKNNFYGVQFHPEKSGKAGLQLLKNFVKL